MVPARVARVCPSPDDPPAPLRSLSQWAEVKLWPGWERERFLEWCAEEGIAGDVAEPWNLFALWWDRDGRWDG